MLHWRLLSAAALIGLLALLGWLDLVHNFGRPGIWLAPLLVLAVFGGAVELITLFAGAGLKPGRRATLGGLFLVLAASMLPVLWPTLRTSASWSPLAGPGIGLAFAAMLAFTAEMRRYAQPGRAVINLASGLLIVVYLGLFASFLVALRLVHDNFWGFVALIGHVLVVKMSDTGGYAIGVTLGRTRITPLLSPKKTAEGAVGGLLFALAAAFAFFHGLAPHIVGSGFSLPAWWQIALYALLITVFGALGDLAESLLKRDTQQKDSSHVLPGLGGMLDVLDSLLLSAPVSYLCWTWGLLGPRV